MNPILEDLVKKETEMFFYTDGSVKNNPGKSAFAWHGEHYNYRYHYNYINYIGNI